MDKHLIIIRLLVLIELGGKSTDCRRMEATWKSVHPQIPEPQVLVAANL